MFLKILQNSQENTYVYAGGWRPAALLKRRFRHTLFPITCMPFKKMKDRKKQKKKRMEKVV